MREPRIIGGVNKVSLVNADENEHPTPLPAPRGKDMPHRGTLWMVLGETTMCGTG
ncbi:MAG: hypothetical protein HGA33_00185 [Candidatus Moranbacteria bacterium]|nr:hypothetical protein [Candidatus Moranbacteria bacterium]